MLKKAKFLGRVVSLVNPSEPCAIARKPVSKISDRAKRYRANQAGCKPSGPKVCAYCPSRKNVIVNHIDGDESNGDRRNLNWACKSCNTAIGKAHAAAGVGKRTRQMNPPPDFKQYAWAIGMICRKRDEERGACSRSSDPLVKEAVAMIRATPGPLRRKYAAQAAASRGRGRTGWEVPF
jgi:hypothetical protein